MKHGKHYVDAAKLVDSTKAYDVNEALELACKTASAKFGEPQCRPWGWASGHGGPEPYPDGQRGPSYRG